MNAYMFQLELSPFSDDMAAIIPMQRERVVELFEDGKLLTYSVSQQRNFIWCVVQADSEQEAMEIVASFPLHPYFTDIACHSLLFHNMLPATLPGLSLN